MFLLQSKPAKFAWFVIICTGFLCAGHLIGKSYMAWQASPIVTTITTHSVADLDFPMVTVCPPKGSNTALNYDLILARNVSFTDAMREQLKDAVWRSFIENEHKTYVEKLMNIANPSSMGEIYKGHQSVPLPYGSSKGFRTLLYAGEGSIKSPNLRQTIGGDPNKEINELLYVLTIAPGSMEDNCSLVIELQVDADEEEVLEYRDEDKYTLFSERRERKTWKGAEEHCQKLGGHLASVRTPGEQNEIEDLLFSERYWGQVWIGARRDLDGNIGWSDGEDMEFTNWWPTDSIQDWNCSNIKNEYWYLETCDKLYGYVCKSAPRPLPNNGEKSTFVYNNKNLQDRKFSVWYHTHTSNERDKTIEERNTSFNIRWSMTYENGTQFEDNTVTRANIDSNLERMVKLAAKASAENMTHQEIIRKAIQVKYKMAMNKYQRIRYSECTKGQIQGENWAEKDRPFETIKLGMKSVEYNGNITLKDAQIGFQIHSIIVYCDKDTLRLGQFLYNLVSEEGLETIVKVVVTEIQHGRTWKEYDRDLLFAFYQVLDGMLNLHLGKVTIAMSSDTELRRMLFEKLPYVTSYAEEIYQCIDHANCKDLQLLVDSLGKWNRSISRLFIKHSQILLRWS